MFICAYFATFLRYFIDNNFLISIIGSFFFGFVIASKFCKSIKNFLLSGFCSCFTSFTGFIYFFKQLIGKEDFITVFINLNLVILLNIVFMYCGFSISRKIT